MNHSESNFIKLEQKLHQLLVAYKDIKKEKNSLKEEVEALKQGLKESRIETIRLKDENDRLKVANAMLGENEHRRLMKLRVNRLIKELDVCMAQIKNTKG